MSLETGDRSHCYRGGVTLLRLRRGHLQVSGQKTCNSGVAVLLLLLLLLVVVVVLVLVFLWQAEWLLPLLLLLLLL